MITPAANITTIIAPDKSYAKIYRTLPGGTKKSYTVTILNSKKACLKNEQAIAELFQKISSDFDSGAHKIQLSQNSYTVFNRYFKSIQI